ncbi:3-oxoacyl-ACP reductase [Clostridia bacterium]|nr:3-oxoacyl-ACP reductase [Clostridia bacterium]
MSEEKKYDIKDKVVLITGASVGIGRELAYTFAVQGAKVAVNYNKSEEEAEKTLQLVKNHSPDSALFKADVSDISAVQAMVEQINAKYGRIDVLINNAGVTDFIPFKDLDSVTEPIWDKIMDINVKGNFFCSKAVLPIMKNIGYGVIINISSVAGVKPSGSSIPYSVSKAAILHLSKCLANSFAPEVRVNCVVPGPIAETRWNDPLVENGAYHGLDAVYENNKNNSLLNCLGYPEDIAEACLFLVKNSRFTTGAVLAVDGGACL